MGTSSSPIGSWIPSLPHWARHYGHGHPTQSRVGGKCPGGMPYGGNTRGEMPRGGKDRVGKDQGGKVLESKVTTNEGKWKSCYPVIYDILNTQIPIDMT